MRAFRGVLRGRARRGRGRPDPFSDARATRRQTKLFGPRLTGGSSGKKQTERAPRRPWSMNLRKELSLAACLLALFFSFAGSFVAPARAQVGDAPAEDAAVEYFPVA